MRKVFLTYGSEGVYWEAAVRLKRQANSTGLFDEIIALNDSDLMKISPIWNLWSEELKEQDGILRYKQAAKAFLLDWALNKELTSDSVYFYADCGCEIPNNFISIYRLGRLIKFAMKFGGIAEQLEYPEFEYSKLELLQHLNPTKTSWSSGQIQNTFFLLSSGTQALRFSSRWIEYINPDLNLWRDPYQNEKQMDRFVSHRRDQSIFSLLWKEFDLPIKKPYWEHGGRLGQIRGIALPIQTIRNRSKISELPRFQHSTILAFFGLIISFVSDYTRNLRKSIFN